MAKLVYGLNRSLDGYVDHLEFRPSPALFRHFTERVRDLTAIVYGRRMYEVMRYWDEDSADWVAGGTRIRGGVVTIEAVIRRLKAQPGGEIEFAGPDLAGSLTNLGLIDENRLYLNHRTWSRQAILLRPPAAAPSCDQRSRCPGRDQVDVRSRLVAGLARRTARTPGFPPILLATDAWNVAS